MTQTKDEPTEYRLKKYEEMYSFFKTSYSDESSRFEKIEEKVSRYFSLMTIVLGVSAFGISTFADFCQRSKNFSEWGFIISYSISAAFVFLAIIAFIRSLSFQDQKTISIDDDLIEHFDKNRYIDVIYSMSKGIAEVVKQNRIITERKIIAANFGYYCVIISIFLIPITVSFYLWASVKSLVTSSP